MAGAVRIGVGGWTFAPWRGVFYPPGLPHKRELQHASRALGSIEINGTFYATFKPDSWRRWHDDTPDDFVFAVKGSRYCTNRRVLAEAGPGIERFVAQGLTGLGRKLGPICWQLPGTKALDPADLAAFLALLPPERDGLRLRHALEVRHPSFSAPVVRELAARHGVAIVYAIGRGHPEIDAATADFTYARIMTAREELAEGIDADERRALARQARRWARRGDVFLYFISAAKVRNPGAALALIGELSRPQPRPRRR